MATFTISLSGSTVVNGSKSWTVSDADVQALVNYLVPTMTAESGSKTTLTPSQALLAWAQGFVSETVSNVQFHQRQQQAAALSVPPLSFT